MPVVEYGLTVLGFTRKPYTAIIADKEERARDLFGEDIELSERSPLGLYIRSTSWEQSKLWDKMENVYYAAFIDDAEGKQLDGLVKYIGLFRKPALRSLGRVEFAGRMGRVIPTSTRVMTESGIVFRTTAEVTLDDDGNGAVNIEAVVPGRTGNVTANRINRLFTNLTGVNRVINPERTSGGMEIETDEELRERYYRSLSRKGKATRAAIEAALLKLPTVKDAKVLENVAMDVDSYGHPPKCVAPYLFDGNPMEIARSILENKSAGIESYGAEIISLNDSRGHPQLIGYTRAKSVEIWADVELFRNPGFRPGYEVEIRTKIIAYIGGLDTDGTEHRGLGLGQDVAHSRIMAETRDNGVTDAIVKISTDGVNWIEENIPIPVMQIAITDYEKVVVR
jgi:hypothetical protein